MGDYPCTKCGCCCKKINKLIPNLLKLGVSEGDALWFPYKCDETGRCEKFTDENLCSVYDDRPLICNIDKIMVTFNLNKKEFYEKNIAVCNKMMDEDNLPETFRIKNQ